MDQRRVMLAVLLSVVVVVLYNELVIRPHQQAIAPETAPASTTVPTPREDTPAVKAEAPGERKTSELSFDVGDAVAVVVENDRWRAIVTTQGGRLESLQLKGFRTTVEADSTPLELVDPGALLPLTLRYDGTSDAGVVYRPSVPSLSLTGDQAGELVLTGTTSEGTEIRKRLRFLGNSYLIDVGVRASGPKAPRSIAVVLPGLNREGIHRTDSSIPDLAVVLSEGKLTETHLPESPDEIAKLKREDKAHSQWAGFSVPFFVATVMAPEGQTGLASVEHVGSKAVVTLERQATDGGTDFKVFLGPKVKEVLSEAGFELSRLLDFGWFWFIALPMLYLLRWIHALTGNYGVDIILLTGIVRAATTPLTQKSFKSMKEMQKLQPQLKRLQEQYKDDQGKLQKEMMELYKRHGVNPFSGCAPMILQIPIFVGLYNALSHAIELRHAPFALWITDLSAPERLTIAGIGIPVLTILMGGTMILQQWLTPQQGDPTQRQMMMIMPVVFTFMFINFPAGLVLYWLVSNILGIVHQYVMLRVPK